MKILYRHKIFIAPILLIFLFNKLDSFAQDSHGSIGLNIQLAHYISNDRGNDEYFIPINPGVELLYRHQLTKGVFLTSGVNYSFSLWKKTFATASYFRRSSHELAIPLLVEKSIGQKFFVVFGPYCGWLVNGKEESQNKNNPKWVDVTEYTNYPESSKFMTDLCMSIGWKYKISSNRSISFAPFLRYKLKDHWMEEVRAKTYFGVNLYYVIAL